MAMQQFLDPELDCNLDDEEIVQTGLCLVQEETEEVRCIRWESRADDQLLLGTLHQLYASNE